MKASTILKLIERALNPDLKEAHIKAYAEAMIKQDRERVEENAVYFDGSADIEATHNNTPIILE